MMNLMNRTVDIFSGRPFAFTSSSSGMMIVCSSITPSSAAS